MQWKEIKGYEGYYEVSNTGLVRSVDRIITDSNGKQRFLRGNIMKACESKNRDRNGTGYYVVNLRKSDGGKVIPIHRLVAETFIKNDNNLPTVNHIDGNKHNNIVSNLEWSSYSENNFHALHHNLRNPRRNPIAQKDMNGNFIGEYESVTEAARLTGISRGMISHCINNRANHAGGFAWEKIVKCNDYPITGSTSDDELQMEKQGRE